MREANLEKAVAVTTVSTALITAAVTFALLLVAVRFMWGWVLPDLFPGLVSQGLIASELSWLAALKLALFLALLSGLGKLLVGPIRV